MDGEKANDSDPDYKIRPPKKRKKKGRPKKPKLKLDECSPQQLRKRTKPFFDKIVAECEKENIEFSKFLAYMGRRYYQDGSSTHYSKEKGQIFDSIYQDKDPYEQKKLSPKQGVFLKKNLDIGRRRYTELRKFLNPYVHLPGTDVVREEEKKIVPKFEPALKGLWCPLAKLLTKHTTDLMENMITEIDDNDSPMLETLAQDEIIVKGGGGFDASGRHSTFRYTLVHKFSYP